MKCPYAINGLQCIHIDTSAMNQLVSCDECHVKKQVTDRPLKIAIDFDGTVVTHDFPRIGDDVGAIPVLRKLVEKGHALILFTMRSDDGEKYLTQAIEWFERSGIPLFGIQTDPSQKLWTSSPKANADLYIDDLALGVPLKFDEKTRRAYVDWIEVEKWLVKNGYL